MPNLIGPFRQAIPTPTNLYSSDVVLVLDFSGSQTGNEPFYLSNGTYFIDWRNMDNSSFERPSAAISQNTSNTLINFTVGNPRITNKGLYIEGGK